MTVRALVFAGDSEQGIDPRLVPKQVVAPHRKPVIVYTLEHFEKHPDVKDIVVACPATWVEELRGLLDKHSLHKVSQIVAGGSGGDESVYVGLKALQGLAAPNDIILIHDAARPLIDADLITANIAAAAEYGAVITVESATESIVWLNDGDRMHRVPPLGQMRLAKAPQTFTYELIWDLYDWAHHNGKRTTDSAHLCAICGLKPKTVASTPHNIRITRPMDHYVFSALVEASENPQAAGV